MANIQFECAFFNTFISEELARTLSMNNTIVIGFNGLLDSIGAIEFATGFYTALGYQKDYKTAYKVGVQTLLGGKYSNYQSKLFAYFNGLLL